MDDFVLALGSNLGERGRTLKEAVVSIGEFCEVKMLSKIYETPPVGYENQGDFFNMAIFCQAEISPETLLEKCNETEEKFGRVRSFKNAPRTLDIDIVFFENLQIKTPRLEIPHPRWKERDFVITPLLDLLEQGAFDGENYAFVKEILKTKTRKFNPVKDL